MQRFVTLCVLFLLIIAGSAAAYQRMVLIEELTSSTCPPCYTAGQVLEDIIDNYDGSVAMIAYHMNWPAPGNDPWYARNETHNNARRSYYNVNAIPDLFVDGILNPNPTNYGSVAGAINNRIGETSPLLIEIEPDFDGNNVTADVSVTSEEDIAGNYRIHMAMCEIEVHWDQPAPNNQTLFEFPMLEMYPGGTGSEFEIGLGETNEYAASFPYEDDWQVPNLAIVVFVQNNTTKEVLQSAWTAVPANTPLLMHGSSEILDEGQANPNGRPDAGETVDMVVTLENHPDYLPAANISGTLTCADPLIEITDNSAEWADVNPGQETANNDDPFTFSVPEGYDPAYVEFTIELTADGYNRTLTFEELLGVPEILLINDVDTATDYEDHWQNMFSSLGFIADVQEGGIVWISDIEMYDAIIWATGGSNSEDNCLSDLERLAIQQYLDGGGNLILTSQYAGDYVDDETWWSTYFGVAHDQDAVPSPSNLSLNGSAGSPWNGMNFFLIGSEGAGNSTSPSSMTITDGAVSFGTYFNSDAIAAVGKETDTFRSVYCGFALEAISGAQGSTTNDIALNQLLYWVRGMENSSPEPDDGPMPDFVILASYPNPFNPSLTISYGTRGHDNLRLEVLNSLGRRVALLHQGPTATGYHNLSWNAADLSSGAYFVRLSCPDGVKTQKVMLLK